MTAVSTEPKPKRSHSGTAKWHTSKAAVDQAPYEVLQWSDKRCLKYLVELRFGSFKTVGCPHCGTIGKHYWREFDKRWKCEGCGSGFSITSKTVFASRKKSLQLIMYAVAEWLISMGGKPALELRRALNVRYTTAFVLEHKLRESLVRGFNVGVLSGDVEMDGAHQSGRRSAEKRGKPQGAQPIDAETPQENLQETMLEGQNKKKDKKQTAVPTNDYGSPLPANRRILFAVRKRSGVRGRGANATRVAIGMSEEPGVVGEVIKSFVAVPESHLNTDTHTAYSKLGKQFRTHRTVAHSKTLSGPNGENNNQAEELNARFDRAEKGIYLNIEPKYLHDYATEVAFRSDIRRMPTSKQLTLALSVALSVGHSQYWRGFTHGRHRKVELLHPNPQPAPASGPKKGALPYASANGSRPR